jgi:hypothetical protein
MKKALCLGIVLFVMILSVNGCSGGSGSPEVLSTWTGTYAVGASGTIPTWKFYDDNTMVGIWADLSGSYSINVNGSYTLNGSALTFTASGTASRTIAPPSPTSAFTLTGSGTLGSASGIGIYSIAFGDSSWGGPYSGTWSITKQ